MITLDNKGNFKLATIGNYNNKYNNYANIEDIDKVTEKLYNVLDLLKNNVNELNNRIIQYKYYEVVSGASSGNQVNVPTAATIQLDKFGASKDAVLSTVDGNNNVIWESPRDASGNVVTTSMDVDGNYTFSSTPTDANVAIIYCITITALDSISYINQNNVIEESELKPEIARFVVLNPTSPVSPLDLSISIIDCTAGNVVVNLPTAVGNKSYLIDVKKTDATLNTITIDPDGAELIEGQPTALITSQGESLTIVSDGATWHII